MNWLFHIPEKIASLKQCGSSAAAGARETAERTFRHLESLASLFQVELEEYSRRQARYMALILGAAVFFLVAYLGLCALLFLLLLSPCGLAGSLALVVGINLLLGVAFLGVAFRVRPGPLAPLTRRELNDDLQCIRLLMKEKEPR